MLEPIDGSGRNQRRKAPVAVGAVDGEDVKFERGETPATVDRRASSVDPVFVGIVVVLCGLIGATAFLARSATSSIDGTRRLRTVDSALDRAGWEIRFLDEVLTHSAARFAATGDDQWKARYDTSVAELDSSLALATQLAEPADLAAIRRVDASNQALIALEARVFELGATGDTAGALATMGEEYATQKETYKAGVDAFFASQQRRLTTALRRQESRLRLNLVTGLASYAVLGGAILVLLRVHRRERALTMSQAELLRDQARIDPLTGLLNRRGGVEAIQSALDRGEHPAGVGALFLDLDGFKAINDSFGHAAGDDVLVELGRRFAAEAGSGARLARLGGDEFLAVVPDASNIDELAARLLAVTNEPIPVSGENTTVTTSIGIAIASTGSASTLMRRADQAVYSAKANGKRCIVSFDVELERRANQAAQIQREITTGLARHEFEIVLQPIVETATGVVAGAEALVRWNHPVRGRLLPAEFIPIAETSWQIVEIGRLVLMRACEQLAQWQAGNQRLHIAVNISARHVIHGELVGDVVATLRESGATADGLHIELTETHLLADMQRAVEVLSRVRALGAKVSLDDFGEGHASMGYLRQLPLDTLKIDRSYIDHVESPKKYALVANIIELGRILGLHIVAEGVERPEELDALRALGCDVSQGYLIARPMPVTAFARWLTDYRAKAPLALVEAQRH